MIYGWITYAAQAERSEAVNLARILFLIKTQHPILCRNSTRVVLLVPSLITTSFKTYIYSTYAIVSNFYISGMEGLL